MQRVFFASVSLALTLISLGCGGKNQEPVAGTIVTREDESQITYVDSDDRKMRAAINKARSTVHEFVEVLNNPQPTHSSFSVKYFVSDGENGEHIWLVPVRYEDGKFIGTIDNEPLDLTIVKLGDEVEVAEDQISDWMYVENGKLVGGFTLRRLRDSLSAEERLKFDQSLHFSIE